MSPTGDGIGFPLRLRRLGGWVTTPTSSYGHAGLVCDSSWMDLSEVAATSGVPKNRIRVLVIPLASLLLLLSSSSEEDEYSREKDDLAFMFVA